jgi:hypothetical protein
MDALPYYRQRKSLPGDHESEINARLFKDNHLKDIL